MALLLFVTHGYWLMPSHGSRLGGAISYFRRSSRALPVAGIHAILVVITGSHFTTLRRRYTAAISFTHYYDNLRRHYCLLYCQLSRHCHAAGSYTLPHTCFGISY